MVSRIFIYLIGIRCVVSNALPKESTDNDQRSPEVPHTSDLEQI